MPESAKSLSEQFDVDAAARNIRQRRNLLRAQAVRDAQAIIDMIKRDHAPKRIYQWGSVLDAEKFDENSDIDIAVQGVASAQAYFDMLGSAMKMTRFSVDMVDLDKVDDLSRAAILDRARMVYEQA